MVPVPHPHSAGTVGLPAGTVAPLVPVARRHHHLNDRLYAEAERRLRRDLTDSELHIDLAAMDALLEQGKADLAAAIEKEKRRAIRRWLRDPSRPPRMEVTDEMRRVLARLFADGALQAEAEMRSMDVEPFLVEAPPPFRSFAARDNRAAWTQWGTQASFGLGERLRTDLDAIAARIAREGAAIDPDQLGSLARIIERRVPGALNAASQLVSTGVFTGMGAVYETHQHLFQGWQYTAVLDGHACNFCLARDGETYATWEEASGVLPGGGPNPECLGRGRCRCRLVPTQINDVLNTDIPFDEAVGDPLDEVDLDTLTLDELRAEQKRLTSQVAHLRWRAKQAKDAAKRDEYLRRAEEMARRRDQVKLRMGKPIRERKAGKLVETDDDVPPAVLGDEVAALAQAARDVRTGLYPGTVDDMLSLGQRYDKLVQERIDEKLPQIRRDVADMGSRVQLARDEQTIALGDMRAMQTKSLADTLEERGHPRTWDGTTIYRQLGSHEYSSIMDEARARLRATPEWEYYQTHTAELELLTGQYRELQLAEQRLRSQIVRDLLDELRGAGDGRLLQFVHTRETKGTKAIREAAHLYPRDWEARTPARQQYTGGITVKIAQSRAHYSPSTVTLKIPGRGSTSTHELAHYYEAGNVRIVQLEKAFIERRAAGESLQHIPGHPRDEVAYFDRFSEPYMGRHYNAFAEILSMGMQSIHHGTYVIDDEYRWFILGLLLGA